MILAAAPISKQPINELWDILQENEIPLSDQLKRVMIELLENTLCVGEFNINMLDDKTIAITKQDGEGGGFDAELFEQFLAKFFEENF